MTAGAGSSAETRAIFSTVICVAIGLIYILAALTPTIAVVVRRLHDTGKSGGWCLISLIPAVVSSCSSCCSCPRGQSCSSPSGSEPPCAEHLRLRSHRTPRCWRQPPVQEAPRSGLRSLPDGAASPTTPTPHSSRPACTRVRGSCRGLGALDGGSAPVQWGKTPARGANPRPEGHDGHLSEEASPGLPHGLTRLTPRPRTCGCAPGLWTFPRGASATLRRVGNPRARPQTRPVPHSGAARRHRHENPPSAQHKAPHTPAIPCRCAALNWNAFFRHLLPEHFRVLAGEGGSQGGGEGREPSERPARQSPQGQGNGPAGERRH